MPFFLPYFCTVPFWNRITLVLLLSILGSTEAISQIKLLRAKVVSSKDSTVLAGVYVANLSTKTATNTFSDGTFLLPYVQNDTIQLHSIGYEDKLIYTNTLFIPDAIEITIFMQPKVYKLKEIDVSIYPDKESFADDFKDQEISAPEIKTYGAGKPETLEDVETDLNAHIPLGSPITFLYSKFSKEAKEKKRLSKAKVQNERERIIKEKYNPQIVQKVTGLASEEAAKEFMKNCPLEDEFVIRAAEYDIVKAIMDCQNSGGN